MKWMPKDKNSNGKETYQISMVYNCHSATFLKDIFLFPIGFEKSFNAVFQSLNSWLQILLEYTTNRISTMLICVLLVWMFVWCCKFKGKFKSAHKPSGPWQTDEWGAREWGTFACKALNYFEKPIHPQTGLLIGAGVVLLIDKCIKFARMKAGIITQMCLAHCHTGRTFRRAQ